MVIFNREISRKQLLNLFVLFILIVGIPVGVFLTLQQQNLKSRADVADKTHIELFGPNVSNGATTSRNIQVRLTYFAPSSQVTPAPSQPSLSEPLTTCKGETKTWSQLDSELKAANFPGPFDHTQQELDAYSRAACPDTVVVTTCKGETKSWSQVDNELKGAGYNQAFNHSQDELDAYNRSACPNGPKLPEPVTTCKGQSLSWNELDSALKASNYNGQYDHTQSELDSYNGAACPDQPINKTCTGTKSWNQIDSELNALHFGGTMNHSPSELSDYNTIMCPDNSADNAKVTTCKGFSISWAELGAELKGANYPGPFDRSQKELDAYNGAACPAPKSSSGVLGVETAQVVPSTITITDSDAGKTFNAKVGDNIIIDLKNAKQDFVNTLSVAPDGILNQKPINFLVTQDKVNDYIVILQAAASGSAALTINSAPQCAAGQLCSQLIKTFKVSVNVSSASPGPSVGSVCLTRPACLDSQPPCRLPEPAQGWCSSSSTFPTNFRLANSADDLNNSLSQVFVTNGQVDNWQLTSGNGLKTVYAQFEVGGVWSDPVSATVTLNEPALSPTFQIGMNMETAPSYGYGDLRPASSKSDVDADLKEVARMGGTVVRVFAANDKISSDEAAKRLGDFLSAAQSYNISVIVSLIDFYGSGHNPQGTDSFYTGSFNGISLLNDDFFASGYKQDYKSFVQTVVSANKDHPNIFAWEPGNELKDDASSQNFINFMKDITSTIKGIDPVHSVATGMLQASHAGLTPVQLYSNLPDVDIITVHPYGTSTDGTDDVTWAVQNGKKAIVEETGISGTGDRSDQMKQTISYWQSKGAAALLNWGFIAKGLGDNGDGDRSYGMDTIWHSADYEKYVDLFLSTVSVAETTGQSCGQCILGQNNQISPAFQSQGWITATTNVNNIITNWCTNNQQVCSTIRNGACNSACQISGQNSTGNKLDSTLQQLLEATSSALFIKQHNLKIADTVPVKIVTLNPNFKIPTGIGTQGTTDQNVTDVSIDIDKINQLISDNSVVHVQFDGPAVTAAPGESTSENSNQTTQANAGSSSESPNPTSTSTTSPTLQPSATVAPSGNETNSQSSTNAFDLNNDGKVNSIDVAIFLKNWIGGTASPASDFNHDGAVNAIDFGLLVKNLSL